MDDLLPVTMMKVLLYGHAIGFFPQYSCTCVNHLPLCSAKVPYNANQ